MGVLSRLEHRARESAGLTLLVPLLGLPHARVSTFSRIRSEPKAHRCLKKVKQGYGNGGRHKTSACAPCEFCKGSGGKWIGRGSGSCSNSPTQLGRGTCRIAGACRTPQHPHRTWPGTSRTRCTCKQWKAQDRCRPRFAGAVSESPFPLQLPGRGRDRGFNSPHVAVASLVDVREPSVRRGGGKVDVCGAAKVSPSRQHSSEVRATQGGGSGIRHRIKDPLKHIISTILIAEKCSPTPTNDAASRVKPKCPVSRYIHHQHIHVLYKAQYCFGLVTARHGCDLSQALHW